MTNFTLGGIGGIGLDVYEHTFSLAINHPSKKESILVLEDFEISCHAYTAKPTPTQENFDALIIGTSDILCYFDMRIDFRNGDLYLTCWFRETCIPSSRMRFWWQEGHRHSSLRVKSSLCYDCRKTRQTCHDRMPRSGSISGTSSLTVDTSKPFPQIPAFKILGNCTTYTWTEKSTTWVSFPREATLPCPTSRCGRCLDQWVYAAQCIPPVLVIL